MAPDGIDVAVLSFPFCGPASACILVHVHAHACIPVLECVGDIAMRAETFDWTMLHVMSCLTVCLNSVALA